MLDVSIVMSVRNGAGYIAQALDSVMMQRDRARSEVIVVDDGSTDASAALARDHAIGARVVEQGALGLPIALNRCVAEAAGTYVAFIDADDVWPAGRMIALLTAFAAQPLLDCVFGQVLNTDKMLDPLAAPLHTRMLTSGVVRRSAFQRVGGFRTDVLHASNVDWVSRAASAQLQFGHVEHIVLLRRIHRTNMGIVDVTRGRSDMLRVIRDHHARQRR